jgi:hypothetical protein
MHLFCAPKNEQIAIEQWIAFWKRQFRREIDPAAPRFQSRGFHHRLRRDENYHQKWEYVRANPVRAGLVKNAEEWPCQGVLNHLPWYGPTQTWGSSARQSLAPPAWGRSLFTSISCHPWLKTKIVSASGAETSSVGGCAPPKIVKNNY